VSFGSVWSASISRSFLYSEEGNEVDKTDDSSDFACSDSDKSDWDTHKCCISNPNGVDFHAYISTDDNTAVSENPTDHDVTGMAMPHWIAVMMKLKLMLVK